jgi:hypothetical protein
VAIFEGVSEVINIVNGLVDEKNGEAAAGQQLPRGEVPNFDPAVALYETEFASADSEEETDNDAAL